ncbi:MAG TPA: ATP-dependent Clp protease ATP-binding subunit [Anaerolineae bacterium]|nr:ATP-dependent Clp protease ATP-binding subunit [Anaerolineae bacterium]
MGTLNPNLLSKHTSLILNESAKIMPTLGKRLLMPEIVLLGLLRTPDTSARRILDKVAQERGFKLSDIDAAAVAQLKTRDGRPADFVFVLDNGGKVELSDELLQAIDEALTIAQASDEVWIGTEHLLSALSQAGVSTAGLLQARGITPQALEPYLKDRSISKRMTTRDWVADARFGELTPTYFRESLLRELISVLSQTGQRHVLLIGAAGSGRRSLAYSLALLIAENRGPQGIDRVIEIAESALLDNPVEALRSGVKQAIGGVLFIPNVARFFDRFIADKVKNIVQKAFIDEAPIVIGTATETEYNESLKPLNSVYVLKVPAMSVEETTQVLNTLKAKFEHEYALTVASGAPSTISVMASRYLADQAQPGAALQLMHRACALVRMSTQTDLAYKPEAKPDAALDPDDVMLALSQMTGIPATKLGQDERTKYAQMTEFLKGRIIGQDEAVLAVSRAVKTARVGLKDPKRPIGSFLFLGPTGVGKTELTKALAEFMFGSEDNLITLDMTEYQQEDSLNRLIGAAPGYVGFEGGGQLTDRVRQMPYSIVLFDECEKAHPRILDVLLQMMDEGRLTDGQGRTTKFSDAVIILTSNLGATYLVDRSLREDQAHDLALGAVKEHFRPEFLNRLDEIIMFNALSAEALRKVLDLLLKKEVKLAGERGLTLDLTEAAKTWLLAQNDHPEWGARPLRRIIQKFVREPLADYLLDKNPQAGAKIRIDIDGEKLKMTEG